MIKNFFLASLFIAISACGGSMSAATLPDSSPFSTATVATDYPVEVARLADTPTPTPTLALTDLPSPSPTVADLNPTPAVEVPSASAESASATSAENSDANTQSVSLADEPCVDKAAFSEDVTYPDGALVQMGETFLKTWKIRNEGTCPWIGYSLVYAGGEAMNAAMSTPLQEIMPGKYADISLQLQAPQRGGSHTGYFKFQNAAGQIFGVGASTQDLIWVQITVDYVAPAPTSQTTASQESSAQGSTTLISTSPTSSTQSGCEYTRNSEYENQLLSLINDARSQNGLASLSLDSRLSAAAMAHSIDMACNDLVSHTGSDGSTWYDRAKAQGFANSASARENIYVGNPAFGGDAQGAFTWWMNSQIHRENILNPKVSVIGIGYAFTSTSTYGGHYTLVLARP